MPTSRKRSRLHGARPWATLPDDIVRLIVDAVWRDDARFERCLTTMRSLARTCRRSAAAVRARVGGDRAALQARAHQCFVRVLHAAYSSSVGEFKWQGDAYKSCMGVWSVPPLLIEIDCDFMDLGVAVEISSRDALRDGESTAVQVALFRRSFDARSGVDNDVERRLRAQASVYDRWSSLVVFPGADGGIVLEHAGDRHRQRTSMHVISVDSDGGVGSYRRLHGALFRAATSIAIDCRLPPHATIVARIAEARRVRCVPFGVNTIVFDDIE